jgi:hypothetical protein
MELHWALSLKLMARSSTPEPSSAEPRLWDRLPIAKIVNVKVIRLEQAPAGYKSFDAGVANKSTPCIKQNYSF